MNRPHVTSPSVATRHMDWLAVVKTKVEALQFGVVQIVVHNGRVTQIECTEKTRLDSAVAEPPLRDDSR